MISTILYTILYNICEVALSGLAAAESVPPEFSVNRQEAFIVKQLQDVLGLCQVW